MNKYKTFLKISQVRKTSYIQLIKEKLTKLFSIASFTFHTDGGNNGKIPSELPPVNIGKSKH